MQLCATLECSDFGPQNARVGKELQKWGMCALCTAHDLNGGKKHRRSKSASYNFWVWIETQHHLCLYKRKKCLYKREKIFQFREETFQLLRSGRLSGFSKHIYIIHSVIIKFIITIIMTVNIADLLKHSPRHYIVRTKCPGTQSHLNLKLKFSGLFWPMYVLQK